MPPPKLAVIRSNDEIPPEGQAMVDALGRLMFNCGQFENLSRGWIRNLEPNLDKANKLCKLPWGERSTELKKIIKSQNWDKAIIRKFVDAIAQAKALMTFRNDVAHGSLCVHNDGECVIYDSTISDEYPAGKDIPVGVIQQKIDKSADIFNEWVQCWQLK